MAFVNATLAVALTAAPWLLLGLFAAGLIKAFVPEQMLQRWVGGSGLAGISRAAVVGAPLPLCSCGAIPTALALHRGGAGRGPTTAFLIGTPGVGVDSLAITYALLGPFMMVMRAAGAIVTAIGTGVLVALTRSAPHATPSTQAVRQDACGDCCSNDACTSVPQEAGAADSFAARLHGGMGYAFGDIIDDIGTWLLIGLVLAGLLLTFVPPQALASYGSGLVPMLLMAVVGIPLYICATAATPVVAGMLAAGVSPGTALVFLLAGPITSMATLGVLRQELGTPALACYLTGVLTLAVLVGLLTDGLLAWSGLQVLGQPGATSELLPQWLEWGALVLLVVVAVRPARRFFARQIPL